MEGNINVITNRYDNELLQQWTEIEFEYVHYAVIMFSNRRFWFQETKTLDSVYSSMVIAQFYAFYYTRWNASAFMSNVKIRLR